MAENEGGEGQAGGEGVAGAVGVASEGQGQGGGQGHEQSVPYARFQESRLELQELKGKYGQMQSVLDQMKGALSPEQKKGFKLDYSNPDGSIDKWGNQLVDEKLSALRKEMAEKEYTRQNSEAINWFRNQEGYAPDLEEKAAQFIKEHELNIKDENGRYPMSMDKAIKLAYKFVTMGDGSGYTRTVKEGLKKPGAGGKGKEFDAKAELAGLDVHDEKYEEKFKKIQAKIMGG